MHSDLILAILNVAHATSSRGAGLSLREALRWCRYRDLRPQLSSTALLPLIEKHPELIEQWLRYSEDKRTNGGYALETPAPEAVAEYVLRELDYWNSMEELR